MIGIVDYGMGNLRSVQKALEFIGESALVSGEKSVLDGCEKLILPGVGSFAAGMAEMNRTGLADYMKKRAEDTKILGICLGMQFLLEKSFEDGEYKGLGLVKGQVIRFTEGKIPQIGWNSISFDPGNPFLKGLGQDSFFYFVHSYYALPDDPSVTAARCTYMIEFAAALSKGNVFAAQFHPEKSQDCGLAILRNFVTICGKDGSEPC